jgi:hypothetical protein
MVSAEDGKELKRLYEQHALAAMQASALLGREGMESPKFKEADKAAGKPPAGEAGRDDLLAVSGGAFRGGLFGQSGPSAAADKADGGAFDPQTHVRNLSDEELCARGPAVNFAAAMMHQQPSPATAPMKPINPATGPLHVDFVAEHNRTGGRLEARLNATLK